ncbi:MAG: diaminopimelate decarboxylase [Alphaproteobacteria bacterium]
MHHFTYQNGVLHAEDVPLPRIAEAVGTPLYCYADATLRRHYHVFAEAVSGLDALICYAVKANSNLAVLQTLGDLGAGADVVSEGELLRALKAGIPASRIVFSGVGKSAGEMAAALEAGIFQFNVESEPELVLLDRIARDKGARATIALRINPNVDAGTHAKISTGKAENKFGIDSRDAARVFAQAQALSGLNPLGLAMHIGSQITALEPMADAFRGMRSVVEALRAEGHRIERVDLGGGLGIPYESDKAAPPLPADYAAMVKPIMGDLGCRLIFEPGRMIVGNAGVLLSRVLYIKEGRDRRFVVVDAAMNDLIRPSLYDAWHTILPVEAPAATATQEPADVVGPVCETGDTFAKARALPPLKAGDLVAFMSAGAYGAVQASTYNTRPLVPEVMVMGAQMAVIRPRPPLSALLDQDRMPPWLKTAPKDRVL